MTPVRRTQILAASAAIALLPLAGCGEQTEETPPAATSAPAGAPGALQGSGGGNTGAPATGGAVKVSQATVTDGVKKDLKEAVCVICAVNAAHGSKAEPEPVAASIEYKGKGYYFCNEAEKAEFISNPAKYAVAQ